MKKPRTISNATGKLACHEDAKGKRTIEMNLRSESMPASQAKTIHSRLVQMIVWCDEGK